MSMVYHKRISRKFKKRFKCLGENTEKYITFTVSIEKEVLIEELIEMEEKL